MKQNYVFNHSLLQQLAASHWQLRIVGRMLPVFSREMWSDGQTAFGEKDLEYNREISILEWKMMAYQYKLYTSKRLRKLDELLYISSEIYNHSIALHKRYYRLYRKHLSKVRLQKHYTKLKKTKKYSRWNTLGSQAIQNIAERIDLGYQKFFRKENKRPPSFRKYRKYKSFLFKGNIGYRLGGDALYINKTKYRFYQSRKFDGKIKSLTIKRNPLGEYFAYFAVEENTVQPVRFKTGETAGMDRRAAPFGLKTFLTISDGSEEVAPLPFKQSLKKLKKLSRKVSKKKKGSSHRKRAVQDLRRVHEKIANQRKDYHFKLANRLTDRFDEIIIEDLNLKGMKALWGRKVSDLGFGSFVAVLSYVSDKKGVTLTKADRWFASTKTCHRCGETNQTMTLRDRLFVCPFCGHRDSRDLNSAKNLKEYKGRILSFGGMDVRPAQAG